MRIVSFFSAKGGTGKTTFNLLFASYLRYQKGLRGVLAWCGILLFCIIAAVVIKNFWGV